MQDVLVIVAYANGSRPTIETSERRFASPITTGEADALAVNTDAILEVLPTVEVVQQLSRTSARLTLSGCGDRHLRLPGYGRDADQA
jgi:hypothetical protein